MLMSRSCYGIHSFSHLGLSYHTRTSDSISHGLNYFGRFFWRSVAYHSIAGSHRKIKTARKLNAFTAGNPFWGKHLLEFSIGKDLGALKELTPSLLETRFWRHIYLKLV